MKIRWTESKFYLDDFPHGSPGLVKALSADKAADVLLFIFETPTTAAAALTLPLWKYRQMLDQGKLRVNNTLTLKRSIDADLLLSTLRAGGILTEEKRHYDEVDPYQHLKQEATRSSQARPAQATGTQSELQRSQGQVGQRPFVRQGVSYGQGKDKGYPTRRFD